MFARVSVFKGSGEAFDEAVKNAQEEILPALRKWDGFEGALFLADRSTGRSLAITLWATEDTLRSSADAATQMRDETAARYDEEIVAVEEYDIVIDERGEPR